MIRLPLISLTALTWMLILLVGVGATPRALRADEPSAVGSRLYLDGKLDYEAGRYDEAIAQLERAYAMTHERAVLYALGQAQRKKGDCQAAIGTFQQFVDAGPGDNAVRAARFQMARCRQQLAQPLPKAAEEAAASASAARPSAAGVPVPTGPTVATPLARPRHWSKDPVGDLLAFGGVALLAAGGALFIDAEVTARRARNDLQSFEDAQNLTPLRTAAIALSAIGATLVIGGVARWTVLGRRHTRMMASRDALHAR